MCRVPQTLPCGCILELLVTVLSTIMAEAVAQMNGLLVLITLTLMTSLSLAQTVILPAAQRIGLPSLKERDLRVLPALRHTDCCLLRPTPALMMTIRFS